MQGQHTKSIMYLYPSNESLETEIKKQLLIIIAMKTMELLGINLIKHVQDLHTEYYKH